jgi:ribose transport system substrate-binding protein
MKLVGRAASNQDPTKAYQAVLSSLAQAQSEPRRGVHAGSQLGHRCGPGQQGRRRQDQGHVADVNAKILDMIKAGEVFGSVNPNQGMQGYMGFMLLWLAKHPDLIDPMNDAKRSGFNPMSIPFVDNGLSIVTADNADDFYWDKYLKRRGTKGIEE